MTSGLGTLSLYFRRAQILPLALFSEKEMATHSSILIWKITRMEEPGRPWGPRGCKESDSTKRLTLVHEVSG